MLTLDEVAKKIVGKREERQYFPRDNLLFRYLYDAYCGFAETGGSFNDVLEEENRTGDWYYPYDKACKDLSAWYHSRYKECAEENETESEDKDEITGKKERRGASRAVTRDTVFGDTDYRFNEPLSSNSDRFKAYLVDGKPLSNGDAYDFIMHTAVAFLLSPEKLEEILVTYGFHPLHVRNIHHMAIYCVLRDAKDWSQEDRRNRNPFQEIKTLYDDARKLVTAKQPVESPVLGGGEADTFLSDSTRVIHDYIWKQESLTKDSLLGFIKNHSAIYDMRHHRLLSEHYRLVSVFSELYMHRSNSAWYASGLPEEDYSLYAFLDANCKPIERRRLKEQIYGFVAKNMRHPTREFMIILWLYAYCFLYCPTVTVSADFQKRKPLRQKADSFISQPEQPFLKYVEEKRTGKDNRSKEYEFRILEYLSDDRDSLSPLSGFCGEGTSPTEFSGAALIAFLNEKLKSYSWRQLDRKKAFDSVILRLRSIEIMDQGGDSGLDASYIDPASGTNTSSGWKSSKERLCFYRTDTVANVPVPLVLISKLLRRICSQLDDQKPLSCDYYELI